MVELSITIFFILLSIIVIPFALFMAFFFVLLVISICMGCVDMVKVKLHERKYK